MSPRSAEAMTGLPPVRELWSHVPAPDPRLLRPPDGHRAVVVGVAAPVGAGLRLVRGPVPGLPLVPVDDPDVGGRGPDRGPQPRLPLAGAGVRSGPRFVRRGVGRAVLPPARRAVRRRVLTGRRRLQDRVEADRRLDRRTT